jgi:vitamin B12 transporter
MWLVKKYKYILVLFCCFFFNNFSLSKDIPIIVISPSKSFQSKGIVGSDVSVITEESINNSSEFFLHDIISENLNGTHFSRTGGVGTNALFQVRGLPKRYTNVYIDGVKISDPSTSDNAFYFNNLTTNSIKQVEILKGNQSSIYGSGAIGGAINIYTKTSNSEKLNKEVNISTGSNNSKNILVSIDEKINEFDYLISINRYSTDGISAMTHNKENDSYKNDNIIFNTGYQLNNNYRIENKVRLVKSLLNYDSVNANVTDINDRTNDREVSYVLKLLNESKNLKNSYIYNKYYIKRNVQDSAKTRSNYYGYRDSINYVGVYNFNLDNSIIFGLDNEIEAADFDTWATPKTLKSDEAIYSQYIDLQIRPKEKLFSTIGIRRDDHTTAGDFKTFRLTSAYKLDNLTNFRTSIGTGIRFGSLYDYFYDTNVIIKENLKPEKSYSLDFGLDKSFFKKNLDLSMTLFYMEYDDTISNWASNTAGGSQYTLDNSDGKVKSKGLEFNGNLRTNLIDSIKLGYTFTDAYDGEDCDDPDSSCIDEMPVRVPRHAINSKFSKKFGKFFTHLSGIYKSKVRDYGNINNSFNQVILDSYSQFNFSINTNYFDYKIFLDLNNILDENYTQAYQYSVGGRELNFGLKKIF